MNLPASPTQNNFSNPTLDIELRIASNQLTDVLALLMNQNIAFKVNYAPLSKAEDVVKMPQTESRTEEAPPFSAGEKRRLPNPKYVTAGRAVYKEYLIDNIEKMPPNVSEIAAKYKIAPIALNNVFKLIYGKPFYQLYMEKRMEYAAQLLKKGYDANKVSDRLGYSQAIKFNKMFQKYYGITPKKFQMQF